MAAVLVSESPSGEVILGVLGSTFDTSVGRASTWTGPLHPTLRIREPAWAVSKMPLARLESVVGRVNQRLPESQQITIALQNTRMRMFGGLPRALAAVREALEKIALKEKMRERGAFGESPSIYVRFAVGAPYHTHHARGL